MKGNLILYHAIPLESTLSIDNMLNALGPMSDYDISLSKSSLM